MRDEFLMSVQRALADRVAHRCSNPECRATTSGPNTEAAKAVRVGVAAHITAASEGGPRYDAWLTSEERTHAGNGIWLCQNCAKKVDNDPTRYTVDVLNEWKMKAEAAADGIVGLAQGRSVSAESEDARIQARAKTLIPLLDVLIGEGNVIYKTIIGDSEQDLHLPDYQHQIQRWRERVGEFCETKLPNSGAGTLALPKKGALGVGPIRFELTRLEAALDGLNHILQEIERYVRRSDAPASS